MSAPAETISVLPILRIRIACAVIVFAASLALYGYTLAPTVTLVDSGELIVAARSLGVAHPPGFPLYVMLAHLATLVPIGNIAVRVNFASALFAALAASVVTLVVIEAMITAPFSAAARKARGKMDRTERRRKATSPGQIDNAPVPGSPAALICSCLAAGLLLAFSRTLWGYATIAEVYTLTSALILVIFLLMFRWRRAFIESKRRLGGPSSQPSEGKQTTSRVSPQRTGATTSTYRSLYAAAFVFGVALGVHHVSVGLMLPAFAALVFATEGIGFFKSKRLIYAALFAFSGLFIVYSYLPLAASRSPIMNWGDPRTFERLWQQVTGRQYQVFLSFSLQTAVSQFGEFIKLFGREFGPWFLPAGPALAIAGLAAIFRRDRAVFWFLALVISADLVYSLGYEIAEDKDAYYLPTFIATTIAAGFGAEWIINKITSVNIPPKEAGAVAAGLLLLAPTAALAWNWPYDNRRRYFVAQDYVENILSTIEPGGMLLTLDWQVYSPMLYFREIEHRREDAVIIDVNQLRRSWYYDYLRRAYPSTIGQSNEKVEAFLEDLRHWDHDPDLYQRDVMLNQRINSRFFEMILDFVTKHIRSGPVYVTLDIAGNRDGADAELTKSLAASYQLIPQGLVFQVTADREFLQPKDANFITRGLADGAITFEDDDVIKKKVLPTYVNMLYNRGRYLASYGRHEPAIEAFKRSLDLNPQFAPAQQALNDSMAAVRKGVPNRSP